MLNDVLRRLPAILFACVILLGLPACELDDNSSHDDLSISPTSAKIIISEPKAIVLKAQGGDSPYTWTMSDTTLGSLATAQETAIYTSNPLPGQNFVTVTDAASNAVTATITQR